MVRSPRQTSALGSASIAQDSTPSRPERRTHRVLAPLVAERAARRESAYSDLGHKPRRPKSTRMADVLPRDSPLDRAKASRPGRYAAARRGSPEARWHGRKS